MEGLSPRRDLMAGHTRPAVSDIRGRAPAGGELAIHRYARIGWCLVLGRPMKTSRLSTCRSLVVVLFRIKRGAFEKVRSANDCCVRSGRRFPVNQTSHMLVGCLESSPHTRLMQISYTETNSSTNEYRECWHLVSPTKSYTIVELWVRKPSKELEMS